MTPPSLSLMLVQTVPPNVSEIQWFASLGVGGVLAAIMFFKARQDRIEFERRSAEARTESEKRFAAIAEDFRQIVEGNTRTIATLTTIVEQRGLVDCPYARDLRARQLA